MKTTIELPDSLLRRTKSAAVEEGRTLKDCLEEALTQWLSRRASGPQAQPWAEGFGGLRHLHEETTRVNVAIEREFGQVEDGERR